LKKASISMDRLQARLEALEHPTAGMERRVRGWRGAALALAAGVLLLMPLQPGMAQHRNLNPNLSERLGALEAEVLTLMSEHAVLKAKLERVPIQEIDGAYSIVIDGANLHVRNGLGATNGNPANPYSQNLGMTNGLGNLILGDNESRAVIGGTDLRTGSHTLVLGQRQNFTSFGGLLADRDNGVSGPFASVTGGNFCSANAEFASVTGGTSNHANGRRATVSGGRGHSADGDWDWVAGSLFQSE
jgi:hypothetical protein